MANATLGIGEVVEFRHQRGFPQCFVEIYQADGGSYSFSTNPMLSCTTSKNIRTGEGSFTITLAPGGPNGANVSPQWDQIITPMSFVLIGMNRVDTPTIVMIGVIRTVSQVEQWANGTVQRGTQITGSDFSYYFNNFNYYTFGILGATAGSVLGSFLFNNSEAAIQAINGPGIASGTAQQIALEYLNTIMFGAILNTTSVPTQSGKANVGKSLATAIAPYPDSYIPFNSDFVSGEGSWAAKFQNVLQFPFYEFFITTSQADAYGMYAGQSTGSPFKMKSFSQAPGVVPLMVGRPNPRPFLTATSNGTNGATITGIDTTLWNELTIYEMGNMGYRSIDTTFSSDGIGNFFAINPLGMTSVLGLSNTGIGGFWYDNTLVVDPASIEEFGYYPSVLSTLWFSDPDGIAAQDSTPDTFQQFATRLTAVLAAQYGPVHLMAQGTVNIQLEPSILPGNIFRCNPFKGDNTWDFYIEGVQHSWVFGGESKTSLTLARGLPTSVYEDTTSTGLLRGVHDGTVRRVDGVYERPSPPLFGVQFIGPTSAILALKAGQQAAFTTAQAT